MANKSFRVCRRIDEHIFRLVKSIFIFILDELLDSLNGMQKHMTGEDQFNLEFYHELTECLNKLDPKLLESVNAQWKGFKDYAASGGNPPDDVWKSCPEGYQVRTIL